MPITLKDITAVAARLEREKAMTEFKPVSDTEVFELPRGADKLKEMREAMVARKEAINELLKALGKADPRRAGLVDEGMLIDRRLKRVNPALRAANRAEQNQAQLDELAGPDGEDDRRTAPMPMTERERACVDVAIALLTGPMAESFFKGEGTKDFGVDKEYLVEQAWSVIDEIQGLDLPETK